MITRKEKIEYGLVCKYCGKPSIKPYLCKECVERDNARVAKILAPYKNVEAKRKQEIQKLQGEEMTNDEHELEKGCGIDDCGTGDINNGGIYLCPKCEAELKAFEQGYAKCKTDVEKIDLDTAIQKGLMDFRKNNPQGKIEYSTYTAMVGWVRERVKQEIAKLEKKC